jgi:hypothetical protein
MYSLYWHVSTGCASSAEKAATAAPANTTKTTPTEPATAKTTIAKTLTATRVTSASA